MKMRKVLSFVLILALVLGSFSMAFAATPATGLSDIDASANEEAIYVCNGLGIVTGYTDGTFLPAKEVNRAEYAAMIVRALGVPESALAGFTSTSFKDVDGYAWAVPYLAYCNSKGIMEGDGLGNVMPGRTINVNEAITMALRAVGYTNNSSELVGTFPSNYIAVAQDKDLYDDVTATGNIDRQNAAQIIYNVLSVQKVAVNTDGDTNGIFTTGKDADGKTIQIPVTMLTSGLGCDSAEAVIEGDKETKINLIPYLGLHGTVFTNSDKEIVAFKSDSEYVSGDWNDADDVLEGTKDYSGFDGEDDKNVIYFMNGEVVDGYALEDDKTYTFSADISGKKIEKLYAVLAWDVTYAAKAKAADLDDFEDKEFMGYDFALDSDDEIDYTSFELVGVASLDKIAADNVVYIYAKDSNGDIAKIAVGTKTVTGDITKKVSDAFYIGTDKYEFSGNAVAALGDVDVKDNVTLYLDAYGDVYDLDVNKSTPDTYGVVKAIDENNVDGDRVKLYTSEDKSPVYNILDGDDLTITEGDAFTAASEITKGDLLGYALDKNGDIESLDGTATTSSALVLQSAKLLKDGNKSIKIASDVVVFTEGASGYDVAKIGDIKTVADATAGVLTGGTVTEAQYILNDDGEVVALLVDKAASGKSSDDVYAVFNKNDRVYDSVQDEKVSNLVGFADGAAFDKNADGTKTVNLATANTAPTVYLVDFDSEGFVTAATAVTDSPDETIVTDKIWEVDGNLVKVGASTSAAVWYELADNAVVYQIADFTDADDVAYKLSSVSALKASTTTTEFTVYLYEVDDDSDGYDIAIWYKKAAAVK